MAESEEKQEEEEQPPVKVLDMNYKDVSRMGYEDRQRLRAEFPHLASYIFMSERDKAKYFLEKNIAYRKQVAVPGCLPARSIHFRKNF